MFARVVVLVAAIGAGAFGVWRGTWAAGGSDSSCYTLMADAFARGQLQPSTTLALAAPWPDAARTFAPGGFIPSPRQVDAASPICSPGFSLLLAPLRAIGGRDAVFLLTPVAGMLLVWFTYLLGRQIADASTGAGAAVVVATMPVFLFQVVQPMNDVMVAMLWTAVVSLAAHVGRMRVSGSTALPGVAAMGAVTGLALLIRPNLAGALIPVLLWVVATAARAGIAARATTVFLLSLAPFGAVIALLNWLLYGHALSFGYGSTTDLFSRAHVAANLRNYGMALLNTQLAFPLLGLAAPVILPRAQRQLGWLAVAITATLAVTYLLYTPYPEWWYLRFFLPVLPMLTVLALVVVKATTRRTSVMVMVVVLLATHAALSDATRQALDLRQLEGRFRTTADVVQERLPQNAAFVTVWESGTVKYHAGREALMWDSLDPSWLDRAVDWLTARGYEPYLILEDWEEPTFRQRFAAHSRFGNVDWPPRFDIDRRVRIFSPADRVRYLAGEALPTETVRTNRR